MRCSLDQALIFIEFPKEVVSGILPKLPKFGRMVTALCFSNLFPKPV
ncbi:hypothetical protein SLEP1_g52532 [Rubroshorea leprosula]|uniref:Uncharacterized protein n=1 Tax=Rubroshorea leprosula TaxID=152421 RepID=A0AAV5M6K1_9ROSI|nr:hypothetical protein SLEP1_g52532 [Rubroshorea leprosula]